MNELMKELWDKAAYSTAAYPSGQNNSWETQVNFMDKFAQLIVRECADVAAKVGEGYVQMGYVVPHECSDKIKKHFGVE